MEILYGFVNQNKNSIISMLRVGAGFIHQESISHVLFIKHLFYKLDLIDLEAFD